DPARPIKRPLLRELDAESRGAESNGHDAMMDQVQRRRPPSDLTLRSTLSVQAKFAAGCHIYTRRMDTRQPCKCVFLEDPREARMHQPAVDRCHIVYIGMELAADERQQNPARQYRKAHGPAIARNSERIDSLGHASRPSHQSIGVGITADNPV